VPGTSSPSRQRAGSNLQNTITIRGLDREQRNDVGREVVAHPALAQPRPIETHAGKFKRYATIPKLA
jgi:hypothetical protein